MRERRRRTEPFGLRKRDKGFGFRRYWNAHRVVYAFLHDGWRGLFGLGWHKHLG